MGQFFIYLFDFKQYLVQRGWFEWGPDEQEKQHKRQQQIKNGCSTMYSKSIGGSIWL